MCYFYEYQKVCHLPYFIKLLCLFFNDFLMFFLCNWAERLVALLANVFKLYLILKEVKWNIWDIISIIKKSLTIFFASKSKAYVCCSWLEIFAAYNPCNGMYVLKISIYVFVCACELVSVCVVAYMTWLQVIKICWLQ